MKPEELLLELEVKTKRVYTQEQREFILGINKPAFVFASPGTGKTASAVAALIIAELGYNINADNIYALSFTNKATSELAVRHKRTCAVLGIKQRVQFKTLHKMCLDLLSSNYSKLDMIEFKIDKGMSMESTTEMILKALEAESMTVNPDSVPKIIRAIYTLNSSLVFDEEHIMNSMEFIECHTTYEIFTYIRTMLYCYNKFLGKVAVQDILLYTLELLLKNPNIAEEFKSKCNIMLVDEAQDLSLLQLGLVNQLSQNPTLIGDPKQQIYGFQGACPEVKGEFLRMHPEAIVRKFTQSFRCKDEIANFATPTILKNKVGGEDFKGCAEGGLVDIKAGMNIQGICEYLEKDFKSNNNNFTKSVLFLYRNNYSAIPLIEELFNRGVPFRSYKYQGANTMPFIKDLCALIDFARSPTTPGMDRALGLIIPEFRGCTSRTPLLKIAEKLMISPFEVNYDFRDEAIGSAAMNALLDVRELINQGAKTTDLFNRLWGIYYSMWGAEKERYSEKPASYYINLVNPVAREKNYSQFITDEHEKLSLMDKYEALQVGVRCYTMHSAKGLEADVVHIIDADEDTLPNIKRLDRMIKRKCYYDAAKEVRNERSLVYVACTRAKEELHIYHSVSSGLSLLFLGKDDYDRLDTIYENTGRLYDDIDSFLKFTERS